MEASRVRRMNWEDGKDECSLQLVQLDNKPVPLSPPPLPPTLLRDDVKKRRKNNLRLLFVDKAKNLQNCKIAATKQRCKSQLEKHRRKVGPSKISTKFALSGLSL